MNSQKAVFLKGVKTGTSLRFIYEIIANVADVKAITMIPAECETADGSAIVEIYNLCDTEAAYTFISTIRNCAKMNQGGCITCYSKGEDTKNDKGWLTTEIDFTIDEYPHFAAWRTEFRRPLLGGFAGDEDEDKYYQQVLEIFCNHHQYQFVDTGDQFVDVQRQYQNQQNQQNQQRDESTNTGREFDDEDIQ